MSTNEILQKRNLKKKKRQQTSTNTDSNQNDTNPYLVQKIMSASPEQLVLYIYDAAVKACRNENMEKAQDAIHELINSLDFEHEEIANTFLNTYRAILNLIHNQNFEEAQNLLTELKDTWAEAMDLS